MGKKNGKNQKKSVAPASASSSSAVPVARRELNVLVIGETGSGKSTFINTITNYFRKGSLKALRIAIPTKFLKKTEEFQSNEFDVKNTTSSKTDSCNIYKFTLDGFAYNFIDTPGLSDTRGTSKDDENLDKIIEAAEQAKYLSAILIVVNGTSPRMTVNLQNVFTRLRGCVPDVLFSNLLVVFTNCLQHTCNFDIKSLGSLVPKATFYMNNSAFSSDPKKWDSTALQHLALEWKSSMEEIKRATQTICTMAETITTAFSDMKAIRFEIKQSLHKVRLQIKQLQDLQDHLDAAQSALGKFKDDEAQFKNYTKKKTMTVTSLVDAPYHSTICSTCNSVCHDHCGLHEITSSGSNAFLGCACMSGNNCHVCKGGCSYTTHYHARKTMKTTEQTIDEVLHDMKAKYDAANQGKSSQMQAITSTKTAKAGVEQAIKSMTAVLHNKCTKLKQICSGFNLVDELNVVINQLKTEARGLQSMDARNTANAFIRTIEQLCDSLSQQNTSTKFKQLTITSTSHQDSDDDSDEDSDDNNDDSDQDSGFGFSVDVSPSYGDTKRTSDESGRQRGSGRGRRGAFIARDDRGKRNKPRRDSTRCKKCSGPLAPISQSEREWYLARNLAIPKTCKDCKQKKSGGHFSASPGPNALALVPAYPPPAPASPGTTAQYCKLCGMSFAMADSEAEWYKSRNLGVPRTCKPCRDSKKK